MMMIGPNFGGNVILNISARTPPILNFMVRVRFKIRVMVGMLIPSVNTLEGYRLKYFQHFLFNGRSYKIPMMLFELVTSSHAFTSGLSTFIRSTTVYLPRRLGGS